MITELFWRIVIYFEILSDLSFGKLVRYAEHYNSWEVFQYIFFYFLMYIYLPVRIISGIYFVKWYEKLPEQNTYSLGVSYGFPTQIGLYKLMKFFRVGEKLYKDLKPMPIWMGTIAFLVILSELGFCIMGIIDTFVLKSTYF